MKKVLVFGTFDILHPGHFYFLNQAKKYGDYLIVVVGRDSTVQVLKHKSPLQNEKQRCQKLRKQKIADQVILGDKNNPYKIINKIKPQIICLGYDQKFFTQNLAQKLKELNLNTTIKRLKAFHPKKYHSSILNK